jgi:hypothetical protein
MTIEEIERLEFQTVDKLSRLPDTDPARAALQKNLIDLRITKSKMLSANPEILRKSGTNNGRDLVADEIAAKTMAAAAKDRQAEERRLGKRRSAGTRRYIAPEKMRGKRIRLIDNQMLEIPEHGFCELIDGRHPAASDTTASPAHHQLLEMGFRSLPDDGSDDDGMAAIKSALSKPIAGDRGLIEFLSRNVARA